ncbi:MAG: ABC transporter permease [Ruminococcus sp.]|nr:ABC transporter permease [Ruminococcus sp.]
MTGSLLKNTFREIWQTKARFLSILAIIALGVGFFTGIKATTPSMYNLAETYYQEKNLMDFRLVSTTGFSEDDIRAVAATDGVQSVMPSYFFDVMTAAEDGGDLVRVIAVPEAYENNDAQNTLVMREGRTAEHSGEIVTESVAFANARHQLGGKVRFAATAGDTKTADILRHTEFELVGKAESPLYISYQRGTSQIGDGKIDEYMYIPASDFKVERYTELYVRADFSKELSAFSDAYKQERDAMQERLEAVAKERENAFQTEVIDKARAELDEAREAFEAEKRDAQRQLEEAQQELDAGEQEYNEKISAAEEQLRDAKNQIDSGAQELATGENTYYTQIGAAEKVLKEKRAAWQTAQQEYEAQAAQAQEQIAAAQAELDSRLDAWEAQNAVYQATEQAIQAGAIELTDEELTLHRAMGEQLAAAKQQLDAAQEQLNTEAAAGQAQLAEAKKQLDSGKAQLDAAQQAFNAQRSSGAAQLEASGQQLAAARSEMESGEAALSEQRDSGREQLDKAAQELADKRREAEEKLAGAEKELREAEEKLADTQPSRWYLFTRDNNPGYSTFTQNADRLDAVASVFPLFFLLVAVLVCVTTMTRLIEEKRTETATLKALGYSDRSIILKYVIYAMTAAVTGSAVGIAAGVLSLPFIIYNAYKIMYYIGDISLVLHIPSVVLGTLAAVATTAVVSVVVCEKSLRLRPAQAMRPKAPKPGKRILLEYLTPLWKHMGFTAKLTARNLFRYKIRMLMTVIGVAGCTALIVAAFGLLNSFDPLTDVQFGEIYAYDAVVVPKNNQAAAEQGYLTALAKETGVAKNTLLVSQEEAAVRFGDRENTDSNYVWAVSDTDVMQQLIHLRTRAEHTPLTLDNSGVMVNEKLAATLGFEVGDTITIVIGNRTAQAKVSGIFEQYIYNYLYLTPDYYREIFGSEPTCNLMAVQLSDKSEECENAFSAAMLRDERVTAVSFMGSSINDFKNMLNSLNMVVVVMIVCAAGLAFVVLYNLTNINLAERVREIATFKVLGFYNRETSGLLYLENLILTLMGIIAGLLLGILLTGFIVQTVEVDNVMFGREIYPSSFLYAAALTMLFALLVNALMSFKIKAVNMVESLKSVE